jgi:hypothetical protein
MSIILNNSDIFKGFTRVLNPEETSQILNRFDIYNLDSEPKCFLLKRYYVDYIYYKKENESPDPIKNYINLEASGMLTDFEPGIYKSILLLKGDESLFSKVNELSYINIIFFIFEISTSARYWIFDYFFGAKKIVKVSTITSNYYFSS